MSHAKLYLFILASNAVECERIVHLMKLANTGLQHAIAKQYMEDAQEFIEKITLLNAQLYMLNRSYSRCLRKLKTKICVSK